MDSKVPADPIKKPDPAKLAAVEARQADREVRDDSLEQTKLADLDNDGFRLNRVLYRLALALGYDSIEGVIHADPDIVLRESVKTIEQSRLLPVDDAVDGHILTLAIALGVEDPMHPDVEQIVEAAVAAIQLTNEAQRRYQESLAGGSVAEPSEDAPRSV